MWIREKDKNGGQLLKVISIKFDFSVFLRTLRLHGGRCFLINNSTSPISYISPSLSEIEALHYAAAWQWRYSLNTSGGEKLSTVNLIQQIHSPNHKQWWHSLHTSKGGKRNTVNLLQPLDWRIDIWEKSTSVIT